jgi:hypothetical protein
VWGFSKPTAFRGGSKYGDDALDPYMPLDAQLELAWANLQVAGTHFMRAAQIKRRIAGLNIHQKSENIAGLQLADLVVSPIGRYVLGKNIHRDFEIVESKFRRHQGSYEGAGLVVLPKE